MLERQLSAAYRRLGGLYPIVFLTLAVQASWLISAAMVGFIALWVEVSAAGLARFLVLTMGLTTISIGLSIWRANRLLVPVRGWIEGRRGAEETAAAWRAAVGLPLAFWRERWYLQPLLMVATPMAIGAALLLDQGVIGTLFVFTVALLSILYAAILNFFVTEAGLRPVVAEISTALPADVRFGSAAIPLRLKLLGALPLINLIGSGLAAGLASEKDVSALGPEVVATVLAAFLVSLLLTLLVVRSLTRPLSELLAATGEVARGRFGKRVAVTTSDEVGELTAAFNRMSAGLAERERIRETIGTYLDPAIAERLIKEGASLDGEIVDASVLFLDVRDFTAFAERVGPRPAVAALNRMFDLAVPLVREHDGHVDKFIGDGLLAIFGAPVRCTDHADQAVRAARAISAALAADSENGLAVGIGINSGPVLIGNVGGGGRLELSAIGDTVNVAARVEAATRRSEESILITGETKRRLRHAVSKLREGPRLALKGKTQRVRLFAVPVPVTLGR